MTSKTIELTYSRIALVIALVLALMVIGSAGCKERLEGPGPYLILYAFSEEGEAIAEQMTVAGTADHLGRKVIRGRISGQEIVLAELGVGMTNAAMTTQRMIDVYQPRSVIVTGIAGSVDSSVNIGDITVCRIWVDHDYGYVGFEGFVPRGIKVTLPDCDTVQRVSEFGVDSAMFSAAESVVDGELSLLSIGDRLPKLLVGGVGVSGNAFIDNESKRLWLNTQFGAQVTDMESAAVAQVCAINGLPFIAFRSASDLAGGSGSETAHKELDQFFKIAADNSSKVVMRFLQEL